MPFLAALLLAAVVAQAPSPAADAGDAAFERGDFQKAFTEYNTAIADNPADADAVLGLGTLDLYRNDWQNARTYLNRAHHLAPNDPRAVMRLAVLQQRLPKPERYGFDLETGESDVPFVAVDPAPLVKAAIGGRTFTFVVDTSAASIELTPAAAQSLGIADGGIIPSIAFPNLTVTNVPATISAQRASSGSVPVDGAIGTVFLTHFLPTFDYAHNRLILRRWESSPQIETALKAQGAAIEPLWLIGDRLLVASGRIDAESPALFAIETAAGTAAVGVAGAPQSSFTLPLVSLGRYAQGPVNATAIDDDRYRAVPFRVAGALQNPFFRPATLTLDFAAMKIIVSK